MNKLMAVGVAVVLGFVSLVKAADAVLMTIPVDSPAMAFTF